MAAASRPSPPARRSRSHRATTRPRGRRTAAPTSGMRANKLAAAAALFLAAALPAHAGLFDDAEARRQIDELRRDLRKQGDDNEARIVKLEEQIRSIGVVELVRSIDELNQEIARLRGQMEV